MSQIDRNLILYLPMDEPQDSTKAYDYSASRKDGTITNANFVKQAKLGKALEFSGIGSCEVQKDIALNADFTIVLNVKSSRVAQLGWLLNFAEVNNFLEQWITIPFDVWQNIAIVKKGVVFTVYCNFIQIYSVELSSTPIGFSLNQAYYGDGCYVSVDDLRAYDRALALTELLKLTVDNDVAYSIDDTDFKDFGVYVSGSKGVVDMLKRKDPLIVDWDSYHGKVIDLSRPRYEARTIVLDCFIEASGKAAFLEWVKMFSDQFYKAGTRRLKINLNDTKPLVYEVYCPDAVAIEKTWDDSLMVGTFSLKLEEPEPIKKVLRHIRADVSTKTASITVTSTKLLNIYWGDGTHTYDVSGTNITVTHDYAADGQYEIIVAGVIEDITAFSTNAIIVWTKL